jgi:alkyl sulfatase BDS1-like metallo-beta-lactamase superfamily hydrolase
MDVHREELIEEDFQDKWKFLMDHFVRILNSMYHSDNLDDNIQIPDICHREYPAKILIK